MDSRLLASFAVASIGTVGYLFWSTKKGRQPPLPPGPPSLPILGNALDIPTSEPIWTVYKKWAEKYGDVFYIRLLTQDVVVLNSLESAKALLEKRSQNYSSRPYLAINDLFGTGWSTGFLPYCDKWRLHRKVFQQQLRAEGAVAYRPMQLKRARELVKSILEAPLEYREHFQTLATSIIMSAMYGYHPAPRNDPVVAKMQHVNDTVSMAITPQVSAIFNAFPWLMHIPSWFPGASTQRIASSFRPSLVWLLEGPFETSLTKMAQGSLDPCIVKEALERIKENEVDSHEVEQAIKEAAATSFSAASATTVSVLLVFALAMTLYPEVQRRAQQEIETVVGSDRSPDFTDRPNLPYVEAVLRESLRWHPVFPLSLPHCNVSDDVYQGYVIPKDTIVLPNVWAMTHDETKYPDPSSFNPARFFDGLWKARIYLADASLWSAMANLLATFVFQAPEDPSERPVPRFTTGLGSEPEPFKVQILPRFEPEKFASLLAEE